MITHPLTYCALITDIIYQYVIEGEFRIACISICMSDVIYDTVLANVFLPPHSEDEGSLRRTSS